MASKNRPMDHIRAARKLLENPYAHVEHLEEEAELSAAAARSPLHRTEDPYATLAGWDGEDDAPVAPLSEAEVAAVQGRRQQPSENSFPRATFGQNVLAFSCPTFRPTFLAASLSTRRISSRGTSSDQVRLGITLRRRCVVTTYRQHRVSPRSSTASIRTIGVSRSSARLKLRSPTRTEG